MELQGTRIGNYIVQKKLGEGGMGVVLLALQEGLNRPVALKVLPEKSATRNENSIKRFKKEVSVCSRLSHPNIVKVFDAGFEDGYWYYAMELLEARTLEDRLKEGRRIPIVDALEIARDLCEAFSYYHPVGIVHRDLKPSNIMTSSAGKTVLTDFGLVKDLFATGITRSGVSLGTPYYMSPEMVLARPVGPASDIFQLGVILYRMVTGDLPFHAPNTADVFKKILTLDPAPPSRLNPDVWPSLETVILNCLVKSAEHRYGDAESLARDLALAARRQRVAPLLEASPEPAAEAAPPQAQPPTRPRPHRKPPPDPVQDSIPTQPMEGTPRRRYRASPDRPAVLAVVSLVALAAAIAFLTRLPSDGPGAADVAALPGLHQAVLTWTSTAPYTDRVELSSADSPTRLVTGSSEASTRHRLVLPGLAPATDYRFQLLLPDGTRSLEYRFRTANPGISVDDLVAEEKGWRIAFTTSSPVVAYLRGDKPTPALPRLSVTHTLTLPDFDPERPGFELVLEYASGETVAVGGREVLEQLRRTFVPKLAGELARPLEALDVARFVRERIDKRLPVRVITPNKAYLDGDGLDEHWTPSGFRKRGHVRKYSPFPESDSEARALGEEMRNWFSGQRLHPRLAPLLKAGQGLLDGQPQLQPDVLASLVEGLSRCRDAEHYAAILRIPFRMGATELFGRDYRVQYRPSLPPGALRHEHAIPEGQIFACPYGDYQSLSVLATVADWKRLGPQRFTPRLEGVSRARRAEITLTRVWQLMEQRFIVRVNGRLKLRFQNDPAVYLQDRNERWPTLSQTFDPVFLREGANDISVEMELIPGTRTTAVKNGYLGSVRISLQ